MKLSFIGTGLLGNPMAEKFIEAGQEVFVYNRTISKTNNLKEKGAKVAVSAREAVKSGEIIILMVTDVNAVNEVLFPNNDKKINYTGQTIIQMGTISPEENKNISLKVNQAGGEYIEAPVLGSIPQAKEGKLFVMMGCSEELYQKYKSLLSVLGEITYIGEVGKASALKLALNQLIASLTTAFSLSLGLVQKEGIEIDIFMEILRKSALYAKTFDVKLTNMLTRNFEKANFPLKHLLKDVKLIEDTASRHQLDISALMGVESIIEKAIRNGQGEKDYSALFTAVNP